MLRRRELFILVGVVAVDLDHARGDSLDVAMHKLEQAARGAVHDAGQKVINARVDRPDERGAVIVDITFSGDRPGAVAALEQWRNTVADVAAARGILRTWLGGPDGLNLEWIDDEYQQELQARRQSADAETDQRISAHVRDGRSRPTGRSWLTDREEAARHPRKTRWFLATSFAILGLIFPTLAGDPWWSIAVAAVLGAIAGAALGEYAIRLVRGRERRTRAEHDADG